MRGTPTIRVRVRVRVRVRRKLLLKDERNSSN